MRCRRTYVLNKRIVLFLTLSYYGKILHVAGFNEVKEIGNANIDNNNSTLDNYVDYGESLNKGANKFC